MSAHVISIDLGITGALAVVDSTGELLAVEDLPVAGKRISAPLLADLLAEFGLRDAVVIERVHAMPTGSKGNFSMGTSLGVVLGVAGAMSTPVHELAPSAWKRSLGLTSGGDLKEKARELAIRLYPEHADRFSRKKDHNRAEAALIGRAYWAMTPGSIVGGAA